MVELTVPVSLRSLATAGAAARALADWSRKTRGDSRALILELKDNLSRLDLVARDDVDLADMIGDLATAEHERLAKAGFDFNRLKRGKIADMRSLSSSDLASWRQKSTAELVDWIYTKIRDLKIRYPHVGENPQYRWSVRVNNIRKRIWLLLAHVRKS